ncbi:MAG TPA: OB-fold domain-containing protein [Ramlibacter sp.]|nr:OB-fold domain-containing protein [Ramlibacter sp.]
MSQTEQARQPAAPPSVAAGFPSNRDFDFFYSGLDSGRLLVQQCRNCGALRNPPCPMCPDCRSTHWEPVDCAPEGTIYSYTIHHHPPLPGLRTPHPIVLADMKNGLRLVGAYDGSPTPELRIGAPVTAVVDAQGAIFRFRLAADHDLAETTGRQK